MDVASLQKMIAEDLAVGRVPLIVIADAGTPITGHVDNVSRLHELCKTHDMWLHLRGHSLAALALPDYQHNGHVRDLSGAVERFVDWFFRCRPLRIVLRFRWVAGWGFLDCRQLYPFFLGLKVDGEQHV